MAKASKRKWFENCGGWFPPHRLDQLRAGIAKGLLNEQDEDGMTALSLAASSEWLEGVNEHHPRFKIPKREERETLQVGQAVDLYVFGPKAKTKQDAVKVRISARHGRRPNVRYVAEVETPLKKTHLPPDRKQVEFGPENVATVYLPCKKKDKKDHRD